MMLNLRKLGANSDPCKLEVTIVSLKIYLTKPQSLHFVVKRGNRKQETELIDYNPKVPTVPLMNTLTFPLTMYRTGGKYLHKSVKFRLMHSIEGRQTKGGKAKVELKEIEPDGQSYAYDLKLDNSAISVLRVSICLTKLAGSSHTEEIPERFKRRTMTTHMSSQVESSPARRFSQVNIDPIQETTYDFSSSESDSTATLKPFVFIESQTQTKSKLSIECEVGTVYIPSQGERDTKIPDNVRDVLDNITAHMMHRDIKTDNFTDNRAESLPITKAESLPVCSKEIAVLGKRSKTEEIPVRKRGLDERTGSCAACLLF